MGHYESCREAERKFHFEEKGRRHRRLIEDRTDEELGRYLSANEYLQRLSSKMLGTEDQHSELADHRKVINDFHTNREPKT